MASTKFEMWLEKTNKKLEAEHYKMFDTLEYKPLVYKKGSKFVKITKDRSVWGFVAMFNGLHDKYPVKEGDLLKAATWTRPARHSRGNIFDGTASFDMYGPNYLV